MGSFLDRVWWWRVNRETVHATKLGAVFLANPGELRSGWDLSRRAGLRYGRTTALLRRMLRWGWLRTGWVARPGRYRRRPRRGYVLTDWGHVNLSRLLDIEERDGAR